MDISSLKKDDILVGRSERIRFFKVLKVFPKSVKVILLKPIKENYKNIACKVTPSDIPYEGAKSMLAKRIQLKDDEALLMPYRACDLLQKYNPLMNYIDNSL